MTPKKYLESIRHEIIDPSELLTEHSWRDIFGIMENYASQFLKYKIVKLAYPSGRFLKYTDISTDAAYYFYGDLGHECAVGDTPTQCLDAAFEKAISQKKNKRLKDLWECEG